MAKKSKKSKSRTTSVVVKPGSLPTLKRWLVVQTLKNFFEIYGHELRVTEAGCLVFLVNGIPNFVIPANNYIHAQEVGGPQ